MPLRTVGSRVLVASGCLGRLLLLVGLARAADQAVMLLSVGLCLVCGLSLLRSWHPGAYAGQEQHVCCWSHCVLVVSQERTLSLVLC